MKINDFRGDLTDTSAKKEALDLSHLLRYRKSCMCTSPCVSAPQCRGTGDTFVDTYMIGIYRIAAKYSNKSVFQH